MRFRHWDHCLKVSRMSLSQGCFKTVEIKAQVAVWAMCGLTHILVILKHVGVGDWNPYIPVWIDEHRRQYWVEELMTYLCGITDFTHWFFSFLFFFFLLPNSKHSRPDLSCLLTTFCFLKTSPPPKAASFSIQDSAGFPREHSGDGKVGGRSYKSSFLPA